VGRFHGPDAFLQPVEQRKIVSGAAKNCLAKVNVSLDETWYDGAASGVNDDIG